MAEDDDMAADVRVKIAMKVFDVTIGVPCIGEDGEVRINFSSPSITRP